MGRYRGAGLAVGAKGARLSGVSRIRSGARTLSIKQACRDRRNGAAGTCRVSESFKRTEKGAGML